MDKLEHAAKAVYEAYASRVPANGPWDTASDAQKALARIMANAAIMAAAEADDFNEAADNPDTDEDRALRLAAVTGGIAR